MQTERWKAGQRCTLQANSSRHTQTIMSSSTLPLRLQEGLQRASICIASVSGRNFPPCSDGYRLGRFSFLCSGDTTSFWYLSSIC